MSDVYNNQISKHYAAYRPPIHQMIIERYLAHLPVFGLGLDIGCGTGASTQAIAPVCQKVIGIDPSIAMIEQAKTLENISYYVGTGECIELAERCVDLVTFAGSLPYAKSQGLVTELQRVCSERAIVVVYDFEVKYQRFLDLLEVQVAARASNYDHRINFSDCDQLNVINVEQEHLHLKVSSTQLAHLLFSSQKRFDGLIERFGTDNSFEQTVSKLDTLSPKRDSMYTLQVDCYYSAYHINAN